MTDTIRVIQYGMGPIGSSCFNSKRGAMIVEVRSRWIQADCPIKPVGDSFTIAQPASD